MDCSRISTSWKGMNLNATCPSIPGGAVRRVSREDCGRRRFVARLVDCSLFSVGSAGPSSPAVCWLCVFTAVVVKLLQGELTFPLASCGTFWSKQKMPCWLCYRPLRCLFSFKNGPEFFPGDLSHRSRSGVGHSVPSR